MHRIYMDGQIGIPSVDSDEAKITYEDQLRVAEEMKAWYFDPNGNLITNPSDKEC